MKPKVIAIIQARMSSKRLPGKSLRKLGDKPILAHVIDRAKACSLVTDICVATSDDPSDDSINEFCLAYGVNCFRGSLKDVLSRFSALLAGADYKYCVRITGDCPFICPEYVDFQISSLEAFDADWSVPSSSSPLLDGQGVISVKALLNAAANTIDSENREHVGSMYLWDQRASFRVLSIRIPKWIEKIKTRVSIDEVEDFQLASRIVDDLGVEAKVIDIRDICRWFYDNPDAGLMNSKVPLSLANQDMKRRQRTQENAFVGCIEWSICLDE